MNAKQKQSSDVALGSGNESASPDGRTATLSRSAVTSTTAFAQWLMVTRGRLRTAVNLLRKGPVSIRLFGDQDCLDAYRSFTARHPKLPFVQRKSFGAALRDLDVSLAAMSGGRHFRYLNRRVKRAERLGYRVVAIDPNQYLDQIMRVHASSGARQGRPMRSDYMNREKVAAYNSKPGPWYGVLDTEGNLHAYCHLPIIGDCSCYNRILGDSHRLDDGIMYLLVDHTLIDMHRLRGRQGYPKWVMYDMFLGGTEGLRDFKTRCGFYPERVNWIWAGPKGGSL